MELPDKYAWLNKEAGPMELKFALSLYGVSETLGSADNLIIMGWAKYVGVNGWYPHDSVAWCGLFKGYCAKNTGWLPTPKYDLLSALSWLAWGTIIPKGQEMLGDTLVFSRDGGGHVGYYVGENDTHFLVYGGNQSDKVGFALIDKSRLMGCRRAKWKVAQPANVRKIHLDLSGLPLSTNEA